MPESATSSKRTRGLGKKTIEKFTSMSADPGLNVLRQKTASVARLTCKCSRSGCLKMYCECFTVGRFCDATCSCKNCHNYASNEAVIRQARKAIRSRNPLAFKPKV